MADRLMTPHPVNPSAPMTFGHSGPRQLRYKKISWFREAAQHFMLLWKVASHCSRNTLSYTTLSCIC